MKHRTILSALRIRHKLLLLLLALVIPPLILVSCYAIWEAHNLGRGLANSAEQGMTDIAKRELTLTADLMEAEIFEARQLREFMLELMVRDAAALDPALQSEPPVVAEKPAGLFHVPPGTPSKKLAEDKKRLASILPELSDLFAKEHGNAAWGSVCLPDGVCLTYPAQPECPPDHDSRAEDWYKEGKDRPTPWNIHTGPAGGGLIMTRAMPIRGDRGQVLGVAAVSAQLRVAREEGPLASGKEQTSQAIIARMGRHSDGNSGLYVIGDQAETAGQLSWTRPHKRYWLDFDDEASWRGVHAALGEGRFGLAATSYKGVASFVVCKPLLGSEAVLVIISPRAEVEAGGERAEDAILSRTWRVSLVTGGLTLVTIFVVVLLGLWGSNAVTRRLADLAAAARRLATGDLSASVPVTSRDEIGELAGVFNEMGPQLNERLRLKEDFRLASGVQKTLLPQSPPVLPGLEMAGAVFFCDETGGDYFDFLSFPGHEEDMCDIVIGDVCGHGVTAALLMAILRGLLRGLGGPETGPAALLTQVNRLFCKDTGLSGSFVTLLHIRVILGNEQSPGRVIWSRAGHDPAMLYDPASDSFSETEAEGVPLGVLSEFAYEENEGPGLLPGQVLVMATDGAWEARNPAGEMFGKERLRQVIRLHADKPMQVLIEAVQDAVTTFLGDGSPEDDVTVVAVKALER